MSGSTKNNIGFILLLLFSWVAVFLVQKNWFVLTYKLTIWANIESTEGTVFEGSGMC